MASNREHPHNGRNVAGQPSDFANRLTVLIKQWAELLPWDLQQRFKDEFRSFGAEHDEILDTIEMIWKRRQHSYAFDESTGLARRGPFHDHLAKLLHGCGPSITAVGVLFIDLDNLKRINDTCGHAMGDKAVAAVGRIIRETVRVDQHTDFVAPWDADEDYSASRHGGDEFLVALELKALSDIERVAPRLKRSVDDRDRQTARGYDAPVPLTSSIGGVVYELPASPPALAANMLARELIRTADEQMYASKRDGLVHLAVAKFTDRLEIDREYAQIPT